MKTYLNRVLEHQGKIIILAHISVPVKIAEKKQSGTKGDADINIIGAFANSDWPVLQCDLGGPGGIMLQRPQGGCRG